MKPTEFDRVILYCLVLIGTITIYRWLYSVIVNITDRAFNVVEYKYLTPDRKVIEPDNFADQGVTNQSGTESG